MGFSSFCGCMLLWPLELEFSTNLFPTMSCRECRSCSIWEKHWKILWKEVLRVVHWLYKNPNLGSNAPSIDYEDLSPILVLLWGSYNGDNNELKPLGEGRKGQRGEMRFLQIVIVLSAMGLQNENKEHNTVTKRGTTIVTRSTIRQREQRRR